MTSFRKYRYYLSMLIRYLAFLEMSAFPYQRTPGGVGRFLKEGSVWWVALCVCVALPCVTTHLYVLMRFLFTNFSGDHLFKRFGIIFGLTIYGFSMILLLALKLCDKCNDRIEKKRKQTKVLVTKYVIYVFHLIMLIQKCIF